MFLKILITQKNIYNLSLGEINNKKAIQTLEYTETCIYWVGQKVHLGFSVRFWPIQYTIRMNHRSCTGTLHGRQLKLETERWRGELGEMLEMEMSS